ncbi:MAG: DUF3794 domain-containing protein [Oscillospiraceae bacterium]|nr:DUF3794 domain-containing protein [Oscillospiraceae bacterium]
MNIALNERPSACCRESFRQIKTVQEQAECIVPDVLEDVGQIVSAHAQICLKSKDIGDHSARIGAEAEIGVLYITESRDRVRCLVLSKSMEIGFDAAAIEPDASAQVSLCCLGVQARAVNPRKISVELSVRAELSCWSERSFGIPSGTEGGRDDLQLRHSSEDVVLVTQLGEKSFVVNEQLPLDAEEEPTAISFARVRLLCYDHQPIGSKILLKGGAELEIGYETQEGNCPRRLEQCLPFSVLIDLPDDDCSLGRVILEPTALYADLGDAINGSRVIELELHATAQFRFERRETIAFLSDAYSTVCPVFVEESTAQVCLRRGEDALTVSASDSVQVEQDRGEIVFLTSDIRSFAVREGKGELSASVALLLRAKNGSFSALQRLISFETPLPEDGGEILDARIAALHAERSGEEITLDVSAVCDCARSETKELRYLSAVELDTEKSFDPASLPSLTIARRRERDLWTLAKLYHSSVEAIEKMEKEFPMSDGLLLIPRG